MDLPSFKKRKVKSDEVYPNTEGAPQTLVTTNPEFLTRESHKFVEFHCNTIYTGSRIRVWKPFSFTEKGRVAYVHWRCNNGLFVHFEDRDVNEFIDLTPGHRFVVDNRAVSVGALRVMCRKNTNDTALDKNQLSRREMEKHYQTAMLNDLFFRFPTIEQIRSYGGVWFKRTCFCALKMRPKLYFCSMNNTRNPGKPYYGCHNRETSSDHCDFFAWQEEFDHDVDEQCKCGHHAKLIEYPKGTGKFFLVCYNRHREYPKKGCDLFKQIKYHRDSL